MSMDAIAYIDMSKINHAYDALADAIVDKWLDTGEKPTEEQYGAELLGYARTRWKDRQAMKAQEGSEN